LPAPDGSTWSSTRSSKRATANVSPSIVKVQDGSSGLPSQLTPSQPTKVFESPALASSVTRVPSANSSVQSAPQSMPSPVTVPLPSPPTSTSSVQVCSGVGSNTASAARSPSIVSVQDLCSCPS